MNIGNNYEKETQATQFMEKFVKLISDENENLLDELIDNKENKNEELDKLNKDAFKTGIKQLLTELLKDVIKVFSKTEFAHLADAADAADAVEVADAADAVEVADAAETAEAVELAPKMPKGPIPAINPAEEEFLAEEPMVAKTAEQEYLDKISNTIIEAKVQDGNYTIKTALTLETLAQSMAQVGGNNRMAIIADKEGNPVVGARSTANITKDGGVTYETEYFINDGKGNMVKVDENDPRLKAFFAKGNDSILQTNLKNGNYQILAEDESSMDDYTTGKPANDDDTKIKVGGETMYFVKTPLNSISNVSERYYTEDDALAQAEYMAKTKK